MSTRTLNIWSVYTLGHGARSEECVETVNVQMFSLTQCQMSRLKRPRAQAISLAFLGSRLDTLETISFSCCNFINIVIIGYSCILI